jgi:N-acetylmuramoyl-L-alanine amidase
MISMKIKPLFLFIILCSCTALFSQTKLDTVVAQKGDGIFSILRKSGIHPVKYYVDFLDLNKDSIKGASELMVGRKYVLPNAPDSFKNMGTFIHVDEVGEVPLFDADLLKMKQRDSTLKNTVYYLIQTDNKTEDNQVQTQNEFTAKLSKDLMERGARVYVLQKSITTLDNNNEEGDAENAIADFGELTSIVNKKYLMHNGSYQRLLMIRDAKSNKKEISITMHHYDKNADGLRLAESFRDIFKKNAIGIIKTNQGIFPFTDQLSVYLAKNLLPSVTIMDINGSQEGISLRSGKFTLSELITKGILQDHTNLNFTD